MEELMTMLVEQYEYEKKRLKEEVAIFCFGIKHLKTLGKTGDAIIA